MLFVLTRLVELAELGIHMTSTRKKLKLREKHRLGPVIDSHVLCTLHHEYIL